MKKITFFAILIFLSSNVLLAEEAKQSPLQATSKNAQQSKAQDAVSVNHLPADAVPVSQVAPLTDADSTTPQPDGPYKVYYENGKVQKEVFYKKGKQDGPFKLYDESGQLLAEQLLKTVN